MIQVRDDRDRYIHSVRVHQIVNVKSSTVVWNHRQQLMGVARIWWWVWLCILVMITVHLFLQSVINTRHGLYSVVIFVSVVCCSIFWLQEVVTYIGLSCSELRVSRALSFLLTRAHLNSQVSPVLSLGVNVYHSKAGW